MIAHRKAGVVYSSFTIPALTTPSARAFTHELGSRIQRVMYSEIAADAAAISGLTPVKKIPPYLIKSLIPTTNSPTFHLNPQKVVLVFTNLTWLLVGSSSKEFYTLEEAWKSIVRVSLGESENFYPQILTAKPDVGPVVVVLYQVLAVILLLNVVIAILLEVRTRVCIY